MYDFLEFIDSTDIREYNKETQFTPAEWAVLVGKSLKRSIEEKIEALQYLADHYTASEFMEESVYKYYYGKGDLQSFRDVVIETIRVWKEALSVRSEKENIVFEACFYEQEYDDNGNCQYFTSYEKAWEHLLGEKKAYLDDEDLKDVKTFARIDRIKLDCTEGHEGEAYLFDNEMRMVEIFIDDDRAFAKCEAFDTVDEWLCHVPLPFKKGDIVKVDFPWKKVHYGVFSRDWKRPEKPEHIRMWVSLEMYIKGKNDFDYTDNCPYYDWALGFSFCSDEELPESEQALKLIRTVRKGDMDFYILLHKFGRNELEELLKGAK